MIAKSQNLGHLPVLWSKYEGKGREEGGATMEEKTVFNEKRFS